MEKKSYSRQSTLEEEDLDPMAGHFYKKKFSCSKSFLHCTPYYSKFVNTFVSRTMVSVTTQISCVNIFILMVLLVLLPSIPDYLPQLHHSTDANARMCLHLTDSYYLLVGIGLSNILLCFPVTSFSAFALYTKKKNSTTKKIDHCSAHRTLYLKFCELLIIVEIICLFVFLIQYLLDLINSSFITCCSGYVSITWLIGFYVGNFILSYSYCLSWYQIILFNRLRDHYIFQRGVLPKCKLLEYKSKPCWFKKNGCIQNIKRSLYFASMRGDIEAMEKFLDDAVRLGGENFAEKWYTCQLRFFGLVSISSRNPLHAAIFCGKYESVKFLIESGHFNANMLDKIQRATLDIRQIYTLLFKYLSLLRGTSFSSSSRSLYGTVSPFAHTLLSPLHVAVINGRSDICSYLISKGADVNKNALSNRRKHKTPPLFWASDVACVRLLILAGANILYIPGDGFFLTAYQVASLNNKYEIAEEMRKWGADVALTPLHGAAASNDVKLVKTLLQMGADPNSLGENDTGLSLRTPLHWASIAGGLEIVSLLLANGASPNEKDGFGRTPLAWACYHNRHDIVKLLLKHGANPMELDNNNTNCVCFCASIEGIDERVFAALKEGGADLNAHMVDGNTALHISLSLNLRQTSIALIRAGSNLLAINSEGRRAIDCTESTELQYLIKKEAGNRDVMISYAHSNSKFAKLIKQTLEDNYITTWIDAMDPSGIGGGAVWREEIARGIMNASVVLCILSEDYPKSQWCMKELAFAKQFGIPIVAVTSENVEISEELQIYLYTRQIIDFTCVDLKIINDGVNGVGFSFDRNKFHKQFNFLLDGVRDELENHRLITYKEDESNSFKSNETRLRVSSSAVMKRSIHLYISHGDCHHSFAQSLRSILYEKGYSCQIDSIHGKDYSSHVTSTKNEILQCSAFVAILSNISSKQESLADQLAFAEDQGKPIIPILYSFPSLDLSKVYSLSRSSICHFAEGIGYEESAENFTNSIESLFSSTSKVNSVSGRGSSIVSKALSHGWQIGNTGDSPSNANRSFVSISSSSDHSSPTNAVHYHGWQASTPKKLDLKLKRQVFSRSYSNIC